MENVRWNSSACITALCNCSASADLFNQPFCYVRMHPLSDGLIQTFDVGRKVETIPLTRLPHFWISNNICVDVEPIFRMLRLDSQKPGADKTNKFCRRQAWMKHTDQFQQRYLWMESFSGASCAPLTLVYLNLLKSLHDLRVLLTVEIDCFGFGVVKMIVHTNNATLIKVSVTKHRPTTIYKLKTLKIINFNQGCKTFFFCVFPLSLLLLRLCFA